MDSTLYSSIPPGSPGYFAHSPSAATDGSRSPATSISNLDMKVLSTDMSEERLKLEHEAEAFAHTKATLLSVINGCDSLLKSLTSYSGNWAIAYPHHNLHLPGKEGDYLSAPNGASLHATQAVGLDVSEGVDVNNSVGNHAPSAKDQLTVLSVKPFNDSTRTITHLSKLNSGLSRDVLSSLLCSHLGTVQTHLAHLRTRMTDVSSRILVTGDLNAGKSTFVNALLRRHVTPMDQQPCTEVMCEILDSTLNGCVEEIHAIRAGCIYNPTDACTFARFPIRELARLVNEQPEIDAANVPTRGAYELLKVYIAEEESIAGTVVRATSLLKQGDISVSFIDAPGLNRDTISTTMLFSKQSTIDVVVFVVSAENQFTLSAQEFLQSASQEKAFVFVVINKWAAISNKAKAQRRILEQVRKLSPRTWDRRDELLHFVDSAEVLGYPDADGNNEIVEAFSHLERSLSSFVFRKRFASKLQPAHTFAFNLLRDLLTICALNNNVATQQRCEAARRLDSILPQCQQLASKKSLLDRRIDTIEDMTVNDVDNLVRQSLNESLRLVTMGKANVPMPEYLGIMRLWAYADQVQRTLLHVIDSQIKASEDYARQCTINAVAEIRNGLGSQMLPDSLPSAERTFRPEVMFARRKRNALASPEISNVGLGMVDVDVGYLDLFNLDRFTELAQAIMKPANEDGALSVIGGMSIGGLALFGTGAASSKAFVDALVRVCEIMGSTGAKRWASIAASLAAVGLGVFLVIDIPNAIPRNLGRRLERSINPSGRWTELESRRIAKETRKVLRLAGWDVRERLRCALDAAEAVRDEAVALEADALDAENWFKNFSQEVDQLISLANDAKSLIDLQE